MDERRVRSIAASQHGLVSLQQLRDAGASAGARRHLVDTGTLQQLSVSVFRVAGSPDTLTQRRLAAVLDGGVDAVLSHGAAAESWGLGRRFFDPYEVARHRRVTPRETHLGMVHVMRDLQPHHIVRRHGVPTTTPARTIVDLAAVAPPPVVASKLDIAWSRRLLNIGEVDNIVREVRKKGRAGVVLMDELLGVRRYRPRPGSALELRFEQILADRGLPAMRPQVHLYDDQGWIGCVDYVGADVPLVVFVDGATWHTSLTDCRHDDLQTSRIKAIGLEVVRISDAEILFDPRAVARRLRPLLLVRDRAA
jgi:very-short-patch-repair endonuclease